MRQSIDTARVSSSASRLQTVNANINRQFQTFRNSARQLNNTWSGRAAERAKTQLQNLINGSSSRSAVLENYIRTLRQQVDPGYENAEAVNTSLADQFK